MIRRPPRSTLSSSSAASDVYKRQVGEDETGIHLRGAVSVGQHEFGGQGVGGAGLVAQRGAVAFAVVVLDGGHGPLARQQPGVLAEHGQIRDVAGEGGLDRRCEVEPEQVALILTCEGGQLSRAARTSSW